nr:DUF2155 domain-containing protein [Candidatus Phycosocius spiralis]
MEAVKRTGALIGGSILIALVGGGVIARQANPETSNVRSASGAQSGGDPQKPEPTSPIAPPVSTGGIDPELGPVGEPEAADLPPAMRQNGGGGWLSPTDEMRARIRREAKERAAEEQRALSSSGYVMPRLVGPTIPFVPLELLFPPESVEQGPKPVRELRGTSIVLGALDREKGTNVRLKVSVGSQVTYGSLRMRVMACYTSHPEDRLESWAYVEVTDIGPQKLNQLAVLPQRNSRSNRDANALRVIRKGWIIASSPAVTPIDHPTYDMWLVACDGAELPPASALQSASDITPPRSQAKQAAAQDEALRSSVEAQVQDKGAINQGDSPLPLDEPVLDAAPSPLPSNQVQEKSTRN